MDAMPPTVRVEHSAGVPIAVVRRRAPQGRLSAIVPEACGTVWNALQALGVRGAGRHVAVYLGAADGLIELEVGVEIAAPFPGHGEVVGSRTPAGPVATITHCGPYGRLGETHRAVRAWCAANNLPLAGPNWEVYGHWEAAWDTDVSQIRTDVFHLLRPGGQLDQLLTSSGR